MQDASTMERDELDSMLASLMEFAQMMLREQGGFFPFGAGMTEEGKMTSLRVDGLDPDSTPEQVVSHLHSTLVQQATEGAIVASGICTDVRVQPPDSNEESDAICVTLEHKNGEALEVFLPYHVADDGSVSYGELFATQGEQAIFLPVAG